MEVKIKQGAASMYVTIEIINNVIVVTPKEDKFEPKDGDVITCGSECDGGLSWTFILKGEIDYFHDDYKFAEEYVSLDSNGSFEVGSYSDAIKWFRPATEEEKQKLFDKLKEEGCEWDAEKKELVKLKWKPKYTDKYWSPSLCNSEFVPCKNFWQDSEIGNKRLEKGWVFRTEEECQAFCDRLNSCILSIKP